MNDVDVVVVHRVLGHELPVAVELQLELLGEADLLLLEKPEVARERRDEIGQGLGRGIEGNENPALPNVEPQRGQAARCRIEPLRRAHQRRANEVAGEVVGPAMVGAAELLGVALTGRDLDTAVAAHVGEGAEPAGGIAGDDDGLVHDAHGHVVAGVRELLGAGHAEPVLHEDFVFLAPVDLGRAVNVAGHVVRAVERRARRLEASTEVGGRDRLGQRHWLISFVPRRLTRDRPGCPCPPACRRAARTTCNPDRNPGTRA